MLAIINIEILRHQIDSCVFSSENISDIRVAGNYHLENSFKERKNFLEWLFKKYFDHRGYHVGGFVCYEDYEFVIRNLEFSIYSLLDRLFINNGFTLDRINVYNKYISLLISENNLILSIEDL